MRIIYAFFFGLMVVGAFFITQKFLGNNLNYVDPELVLWGAGILFIFGFIQGLFLYSQKLKKKQEAEERQAEQDRTNALMREYLEKQLREDNEKSITD